MPYTPIHASVAYLARRLAPSLSLPALLVGAMTPDLEIPFLYLATNGQYTRLVTHSVLGAATLATLIAMLLVVYVYSPVISHFFQIDRRLLKESCRLSWSLAVTCFAGNLLHVLIDALHHQYNPLFYPFTLDSFDGLVLWGDWRLASMVVPTLLSGLLVFFIVIELQKGTQGLWERLLVKK